MQRLWDYTFIDNLGRVAARGTVRQTKYTLARRDAIAHASGQAGYGWIRRCRLVLKDRRRNGTIAVSNPRRGLYIRYGTAV